VTDLLLFDLDAGEESHQVAATICRHCLSQANCLAWASAAPAGSISGVVGGRLFGAPARTSAATARSRICSVDGCGRTTRSRGLCHRHYMALLRSGAPRRPA
jgi:hypothetical protein